MEEYYNKEGQLHRVDGPAVIRENGTQIWYINGQRHRTDGPAYIRQKGTKIWYFNDNMHRKDGPAIILPNGTQEWWITGKLHREDGPAVIHADGSQIWYINDRLDRGNDLPYILNKINNTMTSINYREIPMSADDYDKYRPKGRFTKAALHNNEYTI